MLGPQYRGDCVAGQIINGDFCMAEEILLYNVILT